MNVYVTIGGNGERMKPLSPKDKHLLYYFDQRIIDIILRIFPTAKLIGNQKTKSRRETLQEIKNEKDCLIIDCDILPALKNKDLEKINGDSIFYFESEKNKYGSLIIESGIVTKCSEKGNISKNKCSGIYYVESVEKLLSQMIDDNSIASGMPNATAIKEDTIVRLGDVEDYFEAIW